MASTFRGELMQVLCRLDEDEIKRFKLELTKIDDKNIFAGLAKELSVLDMIERLLLEDLEAAARIVIASLCAIWRWDLARHVYRWSAVKGHLDLSDVIFNALSTTDLEAQESNITNIAQQSASTEGGREVSHPQSAESYLIQDTTLKYYIPGARRKSSDYLVKTIAASSGIRTETRMDSDSTEECLNCGFLSSMTLPEKTRPNIVQDTESSCETYRLDITEASSIRCGITDLIFDVRTAVTITYHFDSWSEHMDDVEKADLSVVGPLLNIEANPVEAVAAVYFPHVLCLADTDRSQVYIAHFIEEGMILEKPDSLKASHAVLYNPTFSPHGVVLKKSLFKGNRKVHAMVLLYQNRKGPNLTFHLYLLPNDSSLKKAVHDYENMCPSMRLTKPSGTRYPLKLGSCFFVKTAHHVQVCPEELVLYYLHADMEQQYLELYIKHIEDELELNVMEKKKNKLVWKTCVRREELVLDSVESHQDSMRGSPVTRFSPGERNLLGACSCSCHDAEFTRMTLETDKLHFIDKYRKELIQRTTDVDGVLDMLHGHILTEDQYQKISSKNINSEKMRELYKLMPSWNDYCKDQLYKALKAKHPYLIAKLNKSSCLKEREMPQKI